MQMDFVNTPTGHDHSFSSGNWAECAVIEYRRGRHFGFVKFGRNRLLFHTSARVSPHVERVRGTLDVALTMNGKDHEPMPPEFVSIFLRLGEDKQIAEWFLPYDCVRGQVLLKQQVTQMQAIHSTLPNYMVALEYDNERDSDILVNTNRPSTAIRAWDKATQLCQTQTNKRPIAIVDHYGVTEAVFKRERLKAFGEWLDLPACIL